MERKTKVEQYVEFAYNQGKKQIEERVGTWTDAMTEGMDKDRLARYQISQIKRLAGDLGDAVWDTEEIDQEEVAQEAVDVAIAAIALLGSMDKSFIEEANRRMAHNEQVYPPAAVNGFVSIHYTLEGAMLATKRNADRLQRNSGTGFIFESHNTD